MKPNTKSSITLPPAELRLVQRLKTRLRCKSNVEVVRRGLRLLAERTERESLRAAYRRASTAVRADADDAVALDDALGSDGLD